MGWTTGVRFSARARNLFLRRVQIGSGAYPGFYPMLTGDSFHGGKAAGS
jgi:hypothetical protein